MLQFKANADLEEYILICFKQCSVCVCVCVCVRAHARMHVCSEHYTCVCRCVSVEEAGAGERGRECESKIYTYTSFTFYFIVILNVPSWVLSPCVKGKCSCLCFVYWWIIFIWLIWSDLHNTNKFRTSNDICKQTIPVMACMKNDCNWQ